MTNFVITPNTITVLVGEEISYSLNCTYELDSNTINTVAMTITDSDDVDVTSTYGGGTSNADGIVTFGVKGDAAGTYSVSIVVTSVETLPDGTPEQFKAVIILVVEST